MEELALTFMMKEIKKQNARNNMTDEKRLVSIKKDIIEELKKNGLDFKYFDSYVDLVLYSRRDDCTIDLIDVFNVTEEGTQ